MSQLPLEDQLRSMILKNGGPADAVPPSSDGQLSVEHSPRHPGPQPRAGRCSNRPQSQQLPPRDAAANPTGSPHQHRHSPHHGRGQTGPGRPHFGHGSPQQRQNGFPSPHASPGYVPPHMRHRSSEWHQHRGGFHQPRASWQQQQQQGPHFNPTAPTVPPSQGGFGPPHGYRQGAPGPPPFQILQRPNPSGPMNAPFRPGPPLNPNQRYQQHQQQFQERLQAQCRYLGSLAAVEIPKVAMTEDELKEKDDFIMRLQEICQNEIAAFPEVPSIEFKCFGSIGTGFATKGSDIDLAVITKNDDDTELAQKFGPRALEKIFLDHGFGARLLTNTRVPIIKFCEKPSAELHANLQAERKKWDDLPEEKKRILLEGGRKSPDDDKPAEVADDPEGVDGAVGDELPTSKDNNAPEPDKKAAPRRKKNGGSAATSSTKGAGDGTAPKEEPIANSDIAAPQPGPNGQDPGAEGEQQKREPRPEKPWLREKPMGPLDFPKDGVGIQCDLNFAGHLGIYNTRLLYCYAISDQRIRDMVIFVKAWAKTRKINSSYNGTLSSYGYALMVLHYLIRIPEEPITPDLQLLSNSTLKDRSPKLVDVICNGHVVKFLADKELILEKARNGQWTQNKDSLGSLLRGFFRYYGCPGVPDRIGGFHWTRDVITFGQRKPTERMVTKEELGWTKARVEKASKKEVRHRYLVCIQDPFEHDHNVGRTVNHQGICAIREEFRRAWRILDDEANGRPHKDLFATVDDDPPPPQFVGGQQHRQTPSTAVATIAVDGKATDGNQPRSDGVHLPSPTTVGTAVPAVGGAAPTTQKGIVSTVDGARRPSAAANGFGAEAIAKVNGMLAEAAAKRGTSD
ncbi:pap oas1 substrate-binding domain-containing protein [Diplodia corticola]|uniref:polynucleotide adenylyltransferase n=1 Tax=Diplodia corticola TaxID=236234 RepID=A0A1J9RFE2_9PEZI|nr:pap oas1 substrate-binding domain-containing protein [Diplodia corticola]OJD40238.1 pap oas1 substrate-binding domain-containing protein [Diplodia corticola]